MKDIHKFGRWLRTWEGGYSNDPDDRGGATMWGVTLADYTKYWRSRGKGTPTAADLKRITAAEWDDILRSHYWTPVGADGITDEWVAYYIVDTCYNSGTGYVKRIQQLLGVAADGIVGKQTLAAINYQDPARLLNKLKAQRAAYYQSIASRRPNQQKFLRGWLRRCYAIHHGYMTTNGGQIIK